MLVLYLYRLPKYYFYYHYYLKDFIKQKEIHHGEFTEENILDLKERKEEEFVAKIYVCDYCYADAYDIKKFIIFPFINCETITKKVPSIQILYGLFILFLLILVVQFKSIIWWFMFVSVFVILYLVNSFNIFSGNVWFCKHLDSKKSIFLSNACDNTTNVYNNNIKIKKSY